MTVSEGTLGTNQATAYAALAPVEATIQEARVAAPVLHDDESGLRISAKLQWLHTYSTETLTYYAAHPKRGRVAMDAIGLLPRFRGTSVHDGLPAYFGYGCDHALCNAHHLRELIAVHEQTGQAWAEGLLTLLLTIKTAVAEARAARQSALPPERRADFETHYAELITQGHQAHPPPAPTGPRGRPKQSPAKNLLDRLDQHRRAVLAFMDDFAVPFDNNLAERDLRMIKVRQKISGCFRSLDGAAYFCRIRGYISTVRKQGYSVIAALQSLFTGQPYMPLLPA